MNMTLKKVVIAPVKWFILNIKGSFFVFSNSSIVQYLAYVYRINKHLILFS